MPPRKTRENLELHVFSRRHGLPRPVSTPAPLGEDLQDFCHHLRVTICPFILGVSGSFTKIERNAANGWLSAQTPVVALQLGHRRWTSAARVFCNGVPLFPMVSYVGWSPHGAPLGALSPRKALSLYQISSGTWQRTFEGVLVSAWYK